MTSEQFAYWMQGFVELNGEMPTVEQWASIKAHLATVFVKVAPTMPATGVPYLDNRNWPQMGREIQITCDARGNQVGEWPDKWDGRLSVGGK